MTKIDPYLHAALLLKGAEKEINENNLSAVIKAAGLEPDNAKVKVLAEVLKDVNFEEVIKSAAMPVAVSTAPAPAGEQKEEKKAEKKAEEDEGKKEAAAAEGLSSLFG
ncbi:MAG: 50S ribosomal protein P1 [Candidatus Micrarchaeota archaeon]|nr:50S ribosomal protein P1 [Candidatus Micrarchaeota archaeon]